MGSWNQNQPHSGGIKCDILVRAVIWVTLLHSDIKVVVAVLEVFYNICLK